MTGPVLYRQRKPPGVPAPAERHRPLRLIHLMALVAATA